MGRKLMDRYRALAELTDADAELCLNGVLKGFAVQNPSYAEALRSPESLASAIEKLASGKGQHLAVGEVAPDQRPRAVRMILLATADDLDLAPRLEAWLASARPKRFDPITASLVLAGIVMVLSTKFTLKVDRKNGRTDVRFSAEKAATSPDLLK